MSETPIAMADLVIVGIVLLGGLLALLWGFVRVVLVIAAWVGASFTTLYIFPLLQPYVRDLVPITFLADAITGLGIFVIALVVLSIIADLVADTVRGSRVGALDRSLGFVAGLVLGAVVVCFGYVGLTVALGSSEPPAWLKSARLLPIVDYGARLVLKLVPDRMRESGAAALGTDAEGLVRGAVAGTVSGYGARERQALEQLFRAKQED